MQPTDNFYNLRTTCDIPMKHFPSEKKKLVTVILKLKSSPRVTPDRAEMVYFLGVGINGGFGKFL